MSINCLAAGTPVKTLAVSAKQNRAGSGDHVGLYEVGRSFVHSSSAAADCSGSGTMQPLATLHFARQVAAPPGSNSDSNTGGKAVVIKKYNVDKLATSSGEDLAKYIEHEVASMKLFRHHHLLTCLASFVVQQEIWVVTPLMGFGSVSNLISAHFSQGLPELACSFILRDVLSGLQYLHSQGVVHRSIRCSHILINENGEAVLSGFRYCTKLRATGENQPNLYDYPLHGVTSNLCWMAPEILKQNLLGYSETSDLYSLGVTACEMANGVVPYSDFPATLMLIEKLRGSSPRLMDFTTLSALPQEEEQVAQFNGQQPTLADSGVGDSVGSCNNMISKNSSFFNREFSQAFHDFVNECTINDGDERPSAQQLSNHSFIKQLRKTTANLLTLVHPIQPISIHDAALEEDKSVGLVDQVENLNMDEADTEWEFDD